MQQLFFIRHAIAMERDDHHGPDLKRPLTQAGRKKARQAFTGLAHIYAGPALIVSSQAVRAVQTAILLREVWSKAKYQEMAQLNPGAGLNDLKSVLKQCEKFQSIALVGHEPDFSNMVSQLVCGQINLDIQIKKASLIEVNLYAPLRGSLINVIAPRVLRKLGFK